MSIIEMSYIILTLSYTTKVNLMDLKKENVAIKSEFTSLLLFF